MGKRYAIWDKISPIITPSGEIFTADQWKDRYPVATLNNIDVVCAAGEMNGGFFGTLGSMVQMYEDMGADFSEAITKEDKINVIEAFEDEMNTPKEGMSTEDSLASIAAALDFQNIMNLPDEEEEGE